MSLRRTFRRLPLVAAVALLGLSALAFAGDAPSSAHVEAAAKDPALWGVLALAGLVVGGVVGVGCAAAILAALFPRIAGAADRQARAGSPTTPLVVGSLAVIGVVGLLSGLAHVVGPGAAGLAFLVVGVPLLLLLLAGSMATIPLLGERLLGERGARSSPWTRAVAGSVALGAALLPGAVFQLHAVSFVVAMAVLGWPVGVGLAAFLSWRRSRRATPA